MKVVDDKELVKRLQHNETAAFDTIYRQYHAAVYANVMKLAKDVAATEDLVQDVFVALWEKRMQLRDDCEVSGWLFVVSYNKTINYLKAKLKNEVARKALTTTTAVHADDNELRSAHWTIIENALKKLSPQKSRVFKLCKLEGKSYEEAAHELGISKYTVKEYLSEAMAFIRDYIKKYPELSLLCLLLFFDNVC